MEIIKNIKKIIKNEMELAKLKKKNNEHKKRNEMLKNGLEDIEEFEDKL